MNFANEQITRTIITEDGKVMIEQPDGTFLPLGKGKTRFEELDAMQDSDIDFSELPELDLAFVKVASSEVTAKQEQVTISIDSDLLEWLKKEGGVNHTRINSILRDYMQHQIKKADHAKA